MERNCTSILGFLAKISLLFFISGNQFSVEATKTSASVEPYVGKPLNSDQSNSSNRIAQVEARSHEQEKEISNLKNIVAEDRKIINHLAARVAQIEASSVAERAEKSDDFFGRPKRPARLLHVSIFRRKEKESENSDTRFYGPPSSCSELVKLGYTLNGYYLVQGNEESNKMKFEVVDCRFKQSPGTNQKMEARLGFLKLDSPTISSPSETQKPSSKPQSKIFDRISHLKNLKAETCLTLNRPGPETISNGRMMASPLLIQTSPCINDKKQQQWIYKHGTHICLDNSPADLNFCSQCSASLDNGEGQKAEGQCLTVSSSGSLSIDSYSQTSSRQQWTFDDEKNLIVNTHSNLCLISNGGTDNLTNDTGISLVKVVRCDKLDKGQEWSFELLSAKNTSLNNAKNSPSQEKKNGKKVRLQK